MKKLLSFFLLLLMVMPVFSQVEETIITDEEIVEIEEIDDNSYLDVKSVPFSVISEAPIYSGCEKYRTNISQRKKCTSESIQKFVYNNFNTNITKDLDLVGVQKIFVAFQIDYKGKIKKIRARASHPKLIEEAERVIRSLPEFLKPGMQKDKAVNVDYVLPITFKVQ